jgi:hypothetical protein
MLRHHTSTKFMEENFLFLAAVSEYEKDPRETTMMTVVNMCGVTPRFLEVP